MLSRNTKTVDVFHNTIQGFRLPLPTLL